MNNLHNAAMAARTLKHWCGEVLKDQPHGSILRYDVLAAIQSADSVAGHHLDTCDCAEAKAARQQHGGRK